MLVLLRWFYAGFIKTESFMQVFSPTGILLGDCVYKPPTGGIPGPRLETGDYSEESYTSTAELYVRPYDDTAACTTVPEPEPAPEPEPELREPLSAFAESILGALVGLNLRLSESYFLQVCAKTDEFCI